MTRLVCFLLVIGLALVAPLARSAAPLWLPTRGDEVVQTLGPRLSTDAGSAAQSNSAPTQAVDQARQAITLARDLGDPRYLGRAQAALAPWWGKSSAPPDLRVLEASILQSRHHFDEARQILHQVVAQTPGHSQAWLILASLDKLQGRYPSARTACDKLLGGPAEIYGLACRSELLSHTGQFAQARSGYTQLLPGRISSGQRAWLLSLLAENEERAGDFTAALLAYRASLALDRDPYTATVAADLYLRRSEPQSALDVLNTLPDSDAVVLRRAHAHLLLRDAQANSLIENLAQRFAIVDSRVDPASAHARERLYLWLRLRTDRPAPPDPSWLLVAQANLAQQKESIDWQLAFEAASKLADQSALTRLREQLRASGLVDARLQPWLAARANTR